MTKTKYKTKKNQKIYKMKGCSRKRKIYFGGVNNGDLNLAYTGETKNIHYSNPYLSYTGKGGSSCGLYKHPNIPINTNAVNPAYPNTGPLTKNVDTIFNNASSQIGGCGICNANTNIMKGGCNCLSGLLIGGTRHRKNCKCSECKKINKKLMTGGFNKIPNGLVGDPYLQNISGWPGVDGISGNRNYYSLNEYNIDPQTSIKNIGANRPFLGGKKQKGGNLSNFIGQDLINLGRQFEYGIGSAYNALAGYKSPINPLPWKDHLIR